MSLNLDDAAAVDNFLHSGLWRLPTWDDYQKLSAESEYAAWTIYNQVLPEPFHYQCATTLKVRI